MKRIVTRRRHHSMMMHEPKKMARMHEAEGMHMMGMKHEMMRCMKMAMKHLHEAMKYHRKEK